MLDVSQALERVLAAARTLPAETVALGDAAGRILRDTVAAERDQPPFDRVTMDGIAIHRGSDDRRSFRRTATVFAGDPPGPAIAASGECIEVMTGCVLPAGADTVVPVEQLTTDGNDVRIDPAATLTTGQFVHRRGSDHAAGATLLKPGLRIGAAETAVLASAGAARIEVTCSPRLSIIATGDELIAPGQPIADHQVRLSNGPALVAAAADHGVADAELRHCPDARDRLQAVLERALAERDVIVLSGGVSRGKADYVPGVLADLGVEEIFHRVAQRPGKPLWFGARGECTVFGLPGNPVSTLVTFHRYVAPHIRRLLGCAGSVDVRAVLAEAVGAHPTLTRFVPVNVDDDGGTRMATPLGINTSGDFAALAATAGFVEIAAGGNGARRGEAVPFFAWRPGSDA